MGTDDWAEGAETLFREIGQVLSETRERRGLTLSEVQTQTHIRRRYLEAMEAGDFHVIPGEVYARGFLRTYARFLELDEAEIMRLYQQASAGPAETSPAATAAPAPAATSKPVRRTPRSELRRDSGPIFRPQRSLARFIAPVTLLLAVAGAVAIGLYYLGSGFGLPAEDDVPPADPPDQTVAEPPQAEPEPEPAEPEPALMVERLPPDAAQPRYITYALHNQTEPVAVTLRTGAACWYRATIGDTIVAEGTLRAGEERSWTVETELTVHLGNPADITITIGDEFSDRITAQQPRFVVVQRHSGP